MDKKKDFAASIKQLEQINDWFQQEDIDLDEGLSKLKEGQKLVEICRKRLETVENEFIKIKADIEKEDGKTAPEQDNGTSDTEDKIPF